MSINFTALDFETANSSRASACAIGLVKIRNGVEISRISEIFKPPEGFDEFDLWNVMIHGITSGQVRGKKRFGELWPRFLEFIGDDIVVAHNASFDMNFINHELSLLGFPPISQERVIDTLFLARKRHPLGPNSLDALCQRYGIDNSRRTKHGALLDSEILADEIGRAHV